MQAAEQLNSGTAFGGYQIVRLVGEGAFGCVYEALRMPLRRRVALKVLHRKFTADPSVVGRFVREAETAAKLSHPNIVETDDVGVVDGVPYIAMRFVEGETLKRRLARTGALPVSEAVDLMLPVLSAVAAMHSRGIIHRDLKPENIQLEEQLGIVHPKVLDFGIAKVDDQRNLSLLGGRLGSPLYMSPEQHAGQPVDARSDLWAMGVILFQCLAGRAPFEARTAVELYRKVVLDPPAPLRALNPSVPAALDAVVQRALQKDPARRFESATEMGVALYPFASAVSRLALRQEFGGDAPLSVSGIQVILPTTEADDTLCDESPGASGHPPPPPVPGVQGDALDEAETLAWEGPGSKPLPRRRTRTATGPSWNAGSGTPPVAPIAAPHGASNSSRPAQATTPPMQLAATRAPRMTFLVLLLVLTCAVFCGTLYLLSLRDTPAPSPRASSAVRLQQRPSPPTPPPAVTAPAPLAQPPALASPAVRAAPAPEATAQTPPRSHRAHRHRRHAIKYD